jgi:transcriptional regulator
MLTGKEIEVLRLRSKGLNQLEISKKLKITQPAVSKFYNNALKKIAEAHEIIKIDKEIDKLNFNSKGKNKSL